MTVFSTELTHRFISITGPDAVKFLQGQASCDLNELDDKSFSYGTLNTPKGRMYCLFKVLKTEEGLLLSMHESLIETTLQKLNKYAVFSKCELKEDVSYKALGIISNAANDYDNFLTSISLNKQEASAQVKHNENYWLNISSEKNLCEAWVKTETSLPASLTQSQTEKTEHWHALETICGIPELYSASQDEFILQFLNLHQLGAVSFKKGCYTGQEIIARMKFLGKQKKQTYLLHSDQHITQAPLTSVYDQQGVKCGTVIRSHWAPETGSVALCMLSIESALSYGEVFMNDSLDAPFLVTELDYSEFKK